MYLEESVPPTVSSPFIADLEVAGAKEIPRTSAEIACSERNVSGTVGITEDGADGMVP